MENIMKKDGWSNVPLDIMFELVVNQDLSLKDMGRMTAVCKSWRTILRDNEWFGLRINVDIGKTSFPWLMLPDSKDSKNGRRVFFNPASFEEREEYLPEARGRRCCGSGYGWIVTMGKDMEIKLLNPLTREQLDLPSQLTFKEFGYGITNIELHEDYTKKELLSLFITKAILTCSPTSAECLVVALLGVEADFEVVFAKPGDLTWTHLPRFHPKKEKRSALVADILFFEGKLFCITLYGDLIQLDLHLSDKDEPYKWKVISSVLPGHISRREEVKKGFHFDFSFYLVRIISGDLVVVVRCRDIKTYNINYKTHKIVVFKLLEKELEWCQLSDIGDCCLFLGTNESSCFSPTPRGLRPNCIYFTDNFHFFPRHHTIAGQDMVAYSMKSGELTPFYHGKKNLLSKYCPPLWVTLNSS